MGRVGRVLRRATFLLLGFWLTDDEGGDGGVGEEEGFAVHHVLLCC